MTGLRRIGQAIGAAFLTAIGTFLILEATDIIGSKWRHDLASATDNIFYPSLAPWFSSILGVFLGVLGIMLLLAQLLPVGRGLSMVHEVYNDTDGTTGIRGRVVVRAVRHELAAIDGVVDVDARVGHRRVDADIRIEDKANLDAVESEARDRLGHGFWIDLGLADFTVNLLVSHQRNPAPSRVR